jgi:signal transduction histidine kinase
VSASNGGGRWNAQPATAQLLVLPPFWRTPWFIFSGIVMALLVLTSAHRLRVRVLDRERAAQAEFSRRLLMQQEKERKRVAGELHDSLGQSLLIIKNRALLAIDEESPGEQLQEISLTASSPIDEVRRIAHNLRPVELDHDDGAGFSAAHERRGIGLRGIAERVEMLGGTYDIRSAPGEGTALTMEVPLP